MTILNQIPITYYVNINVSGAQATLSDYATGNIALFTQETPIVTLTDGYGIYQDASSVEIDWGTSSEVYAQAVSLFAQTPNLKNSNGILIIFQMQNTTATHGTFTTPDISLNYANLKAVSAGAFKISKDGGSYTTISSLDFTSDTSLAEITGTINTALSATNITATLSAGKIIFTSSSTGTSSSVSIQAATSGTDITASAYLNIAGGTAVAGMAAGGIETLNAAIARTKDVVYYNLILAAYDLTSEIATTASYLQTLDKILFFASNDIALLDSGIMVNIYTAGEYNTKCLLHTIGTKKDARVMAAAFASRLASTNFDASNSTLNMNAKDLTGINPSSWTIAQINKAQTYGIDIYGSIKGVSKILEAKNINWIDSVFNLYAFKGRLEVAYFNTLAGTGTKIPQTETGMALIKQSLQSVCSLFVVNAYLAPGTWMSPDTFGNPLDFARNIKENGYYIYSQPVSQQSSIQRENRIAPVVQIAVKEAGAINQGNVIISVNA